MPLIPGAVFLQLDFCFDLLLIPFRVVVDSLTFGAGESDQVILRHESMINKVSGAGNPAAEDELLFIPQFSKFRHWSRWSDFNRRPTVYKTVAPPALALASGRD